MEESSKTEITKEFIQNAHTQNKQKQYTYNCHYTYSWLTSADVKIPALGKEQIVKTWLFHKTEQ